ncbi:hypothetical protein O181_105500 [Austropuccinia psidii MF-1]|uniref:Uncharacterized protein n=1 Tax=Austropuccinia psidii MF-1 TaxID=1389203 RepID=A0A9Q3JLS1_9BASI|nr:hypothetical protein [Austropuccinia psidii MF-1]
MSHTLTYHSIQNVELFHHHVGRGIRPYTPASIQAHAHANTPPHPHPNATAPHPRYCAVGSTSVIRKITILYRWSPFMDDLVRSNLPSTSRVAEEPL